MGTKATSKERSTARRASVRAPSAVLDPATVALTAKGIYEAAKAGVDLSVRLYEATKGEMAMVGAVLDSRTTPRDRFRLRLMLSSACPHGIVVDAVRMGSPKGAPVDAFLLRSATSRIGWDEEAPQTALDPPLAGKTATPMTRPFLMPPLGAQELVVELDRAPVLARIYNKRGATLLVRHHVLGDNGDPRELKIDVLLRDDQPVLAGLSV